MSSRRPRIVHAVTSSLSLTLMRGQLQHLQRSGFEAIALCSPGPEVEELRRDGVEVITIPMRRELAPLRDLWALLRLVRILRRLRPEIVNAGTPKAGLLAGLAARLAGVPHRILTLRGLRSDTASGWKRGLMLRAEKMSCRAADMVLCVSPSLRDAAVRLGLAPAHKMLVLGSGSSNGVDASRFEPAPARVSAAGELRRRLQVPDAVPVIGFVGRITRDKGIAELLQAFRRLREHWPDLVLLLVGEEEPGDPLPAEVAGALHSSSGVVLTGWVEDTSLYYLVMDVLVLPTHREGFPNTVLEAQAAAKPVVTTRTTGAVDSIVDDVTGLLVPVGNPEALVEAVHKLLRDPALARRMGEAGRERVLREFRRQPLWDALADQYRRMVRDSHAGSPPQSAAAKP